MKIKVGDWVKYKSTGEIAKARVVDNDKYINGVCIDDCIKLPIKFKGLNPVFKSIGRVEFWCQRRYLKNIGEVYFNITLNNGRVFVIFEALGKSPSSGNIFTIEEAKDWLELQYATLLAKARSLI